MRLNQRKEGYQSNRVRSNEVKLSFCERWSSSEGRMLSTANDKNDRKGKFNSPFNFLLCCNCDCICYSELFRTFSKKRQSTFDRRIYRRFQLSIYHTSMHTFDVHKMGCCYLILWDSGKISSFLPVEDSAFFAAVKRPLYQQRLEKRSDSRCTHTHTHTNQQITSLPLIDRFPQNLENEHSPSTQQLSDVLKTVSTEAFGENVSLLN